jgi:hypothetical protein
MVRLVPFVSGRGGSSVITRQDNPMAVARQRAGGRLADARRGAGDDRDAAGSVLNAHRGFLCRLQVLGLTIAPLGET